MSFGEISGSDIPILVWMWLTSCFLLSVFSFGITTPFQMLQEYLCGTFNFCTIRFLNAKETRSAVLSCSLVGGWISGSIAAVLPPDVVSISGSDALLLLSMVFLPSIFLSFNHRRLLKTAVAREKEALRRFKTGMPDILRRMREAVSRHRSDDRLGEVVAILREAQKLADPVERSDDVRPLEYLAEDIARGISGRKALLDYVMLAERKCAAVPLRGFLAEDANEIENDLRRRVNAFA